MRYNSRVHDKLDYLCPDDSQRDAYGEMISHAFGFPTADAAAWFERAGHANMRVVRHDKKVVAGLIAIPMGQFFGGESIPMVGVAGVGVTPEMRGRGVAKWMMARFAEESRTAGFALSSLYGATTRLYSSVGYARSAVRARFEVDLHMLEPLRVPRGVATTQVQGAPPELRELYTEWARRHPGHLDRSPEIWIRVTAPRHHTTRTFLVHEEGRLTGYTVLSHKMDGEKGKVQAWCTVATTKAAVTAILSIFGSYGSIAPSITFFGSPTHTLVSGLAERHHKIDLPWYLMTRTLDVGRALAARSYPRSAACDVSMVVTRGPGTGLSEREAVRLVTSGGRAQIFAAASSTPPLAISESGFTQLYTGFRSARELMDLGDITLSSGASRDDIEALDELFRGPTPSLPDFF